MQGPHLAAAVVLVATSLACTPTAIPAPSVTAPASATARASEVLLTPSASRALVGATFTFPPGPVTWCGQLTSYRATSPTQIGELTIGNTTFVPSLSGSIQPEVRPGVGVCLTGTVVRSETTANQLGSFSLGYAPGTVPRGPIPASACGLITDVFVDDIPSGGTVVLNGTKFLVGGARLSADMVVLPQGLRPGLSLCIVETRLIPSPDGSFTAVGGRAVVMP